MKTTTEFKSLLKEKGEAIKALKKEIRSKSKASSREWSNLRATQMDYRIDHILYTLTLRGEIVNEEESELIADDLFDIRLSSLFIIYNRIIELGIEKENSKNIPSKKRLEERLNELIKNGFITKEKE